MIIKNNIEKNKYIIILDTNVLLNIYRYSPEFSEFALKCLSKIKNHLYLPATVRLEYEKHYKKEFSKMNKRISEATKETENQINNARRKILDSCKNLERLQFTDVDELKDQLDVKLNDVAKVLKDFFDERTSLKISQNFWNGKDHVNLLVNEIHNSHRIFPAPSQEELYKWCEIGEKRYKSEMPPGFRDAKNKDGIRKYSDYIIWSEILRYARNKKTNIIFVTDDVKTDWWEDVEQGKQFHSKLISEFKNTQQSLIPLTSFQFYQFISEEFEIELEDTIEIALKMTDNDYSDKIYEAVFDSISYSLHINALDYICEQSNIGSEGIEEFEISDYNFISAKRIERHDNLATYEFKYEVTIEGTSFDYWGRDDDTREIYLSPARYHEFKGNIIVLVERQVEMFYDFENDNEFESATILNGELHEISFYDSNQDYYDEYSELGVCPCCGNMLNLENNSGDGFCINCSNKQL